MLKEILLLQLCVCVINCEKSKCDYKEIIDLQTNTVFPDKDEFCKDKVCVFRMCRKMNSMKIIKEDLENLKRKCTSFNEIEKLTNRTIDVPVFKTEYSKELTRSNKTINQFRFVAYKRWPKMINEKCVGPTFASDGDERLLEDGSLFLSRRNMVIPSNRIVVEFQMRQTPDERWSGPEIIYKILDTDEEAVAADTAMPSIILYEVIGMMTSCVFLILILVVYSMFKKLRGQYGKILMTYIGCFTISYMVNITQTVGLNFGWFNDVGCKYISSILLYSIMTTFFWLNVMSYEIWNTFRPKNKYRSIRLRKYHHRFLIACLYAFGIPVVMLAVVVLIDEKELTNIRPDLATCMHSTENQLFYYVPITIILCMNLLFFISTSYYVWQQKKSKALDSSESSITKRNKNNYGLFIKLSISTGLNWFLDVIGVYAKLPTYMDYIIDFYALYQGVILFIICVCNKSVISLLKKRFSNKSHFVNQSSYTSSATHDSKKSGSRKKSQTDSNHETK